MTRLVLAAALALALPAVQAQAASRTFVSAAGNDSNPCTITLPCRNLQAAYNAVAPNGQVEALDPGNYGSLTIIGPVSIQGHGWASMSANTGAAITINSPGASDKISISGVVLDGLGITGATGIDFKSSGSLNVQDSVIRNFSNNGISFESTSSSLNQLFVSNTLVSDNAGHGIAIEPAGFGTTNCVLDRVKMQNNAQNGLDVEAIIQTINVIVSDSVIANNGSIGILDRSSGGASSIMVRNSTIANNSSNGLAVANPGAVMSITRSTITGNGTGSSGNVGSFGNNEIFGNGSGNGALTSISPN
jgi:hypothetical protein